MTGRELIIALMDMVKLDKEVMICATINGQTHALRAESVRPWIKHIPNEDWEIVTDAITVDETGERL